MSGRSSRTIKQPLRFIDKESNVEDSSSELSTYSTDESSSDSVLSADEQPLCSGPSHDDHIPPQGRGRCRGSAHH
ncbi:hypothetical protein CHARACLAT_027196 [Characodon lateralis]|uniref:Uncharacterized protein n=1 Tax=Characodon lateralis TaxID=208331 RepID=A0ABU7EH91_9TELE|nr:hypothetical protein [Characodon lateralis]